MRRFFETLRMRPGGQRECILRVLSCQGQSHDVLTVKQGKANKQIMGIWHKASEMFAESVQASVCNLMKKLIVCTIHNKEESSLAIQ